MEGGWLQGGRVEGRWLRREGGRWVAVVEGR